MRSAALDGYTFLDGHLGAAGARGQRREASTLWNATRILMGLRYEEEQVDAIIEEGTAMLFGIRGIEESSVYQGIVGECEAKGEAKGEAEGIGEALLIEGRKMLGPVDERI